MQLFSESCFTTSSRPKKLGGLSLHIEHGPLDLKIHLVNWDLVCTPKKLGGLGVLDLKTLNMALLSKWFWQWASKEDKLWKSIFQVLYTWQGDTIIHSHFFKNHLKMVFPFCQSFVDRIIGNGKTIDFWHENWGNGILSQKFHICLGNEQHTGTVRVGY